MRLRQNVYVSAFKAALQAKLEYRTDLVIGLVTSIMLQLAALSFLSIVLATTPELGGFRGAEVVFLFGLVATCLGASELLFNQIWLLPSSIVMGDLDRLLTYPVNTLLFFLVTRPELHALGNLLTGLCYVAGSLWVLGAAWTTWLSVPLWIVCGTLLYTALLVLFASVSFRTLGHFGQQLFIPHNLLQASRYPLSVYPAWLRGLLLIVVPYGACNYLPASVLFGKGGSALSFLVAPSVTAVFVVLAHAAWKAGLRRYESSGS
ncbi:MAG TPA: ABC-2 family transporter protein [Polyangiaceae bacterium]|jgi:ABC-2 type transport system permease protein|nr:ABC-2 family transporter protein [Polyangiaceae bacterium]